MTTITTNTASLVPIKEGWESPLEYLLRIMNDSRIDGIRRDRVAGLILPYCHVNRNRSGKKVEQIDKAKLANISFPVRPTPRRPTMYADDESVNILDYLS
jgi:hypothetical protein